MTDARGMAIVQSYASHEMPKAALFALSHSTEKCGGIIAYARARLATTKRVVARDF